MKAGQQSAGHPVDIATGTVYSTHKDVVIPGHVSLIWERRYSTALLDQPPSPLGPGWTTRYFASLTKRQNEYHFLAPEGAIEVFADPQDQISKGEVVRNLGSFLELCKVDNRLVVVRWNSDIDSIERYVFDYGVPGAVWPLRSIENFTGQGLDMIRDQSGRLIGIRQRIEGRTLALEYTDDNRIRQVSLVQPGQHLVARYEYREGRLVAAENALQYADRYEYDANGRMTREILKDGGVFSFRYNERGKCVRTSGQNNYDAKTFQYLDSAGITHVVDSRGNMSTYRWMPSGQIVAEFDPLGAETTTDYDEHGRIAAITFPTGGTRAFQYDDQGNRSKTIEPSGSTMEYLYNGNHQPIQYTDSAGRIWKRTYDSRGNLTASIDPEELTWRFDWSQNDQIVAITNPQGAQRRISYDSKGILQAETDWLGRRTEYRFDDFGNLIAQIDPDGNKTQLTRDLLHRLISILWSNGGVTRFEYDVGDNLTTLIEPTGHMKRFRYATCGRMIEESDGSGLKVQYVWGTEPKQLEKIINEKGEIFEFEIDAVGRATKLVTFDGRVIEYDYDLAGNRVAERRNSRLAVKYEYDIAGRLISREVEGDKATFEFNAQGRVASAINKEIEIHYEYDAWGRVARERQGEHVLEFRYDPLDRVLSLATNLDHEVAYSYDANGDLAAVHTRQGDELRFDRDVMRNETRRQIPGGLELLQQYNQRGQITSQILAQRGSVLKEPSSASSWSALVTRGWDYDAAGSLVSSSDQFWGTRKYRYDLRDQLLQVDWRRGNENFSYDPAGNLLTAARTGRPTQRCQYLSGNRLQSQGEFRFEYDDFGRQTQKTWVREGAAEQVWKFTWNDLDQLIGVKTPEGKQWTYAYDAFGRRIRKTGSDEVVEFVWDRFDVIHEKRNERVRSWIYDEYSYSLLAQIEDRRFYSVIHDQNGTPRELVNAGRIAWRGNHWAWGERIENGESSAVNCPWAFPGQYLDTETGLHYNCYRYYDPSLGRYLSPDPLEIVGGLNPYTYCRNPVRWIDPLGLCKKEYVYVLKDKEGNVVYIGITNDPKRRVQQHAKGDENRTPPIEPKDFHTMEVVTGPLTHNQARNIEAKMIRDHLEQSGVSPMMPDGKTPKPVETQLNEAGLQNKNRGRDDNASQRRGADYASMDKVDQDNPTDKLNKQGKSID